MLYQITIFSKRQSVPMVKYIGGSICVCRPDHCYDIATDKLHQQQSSKIILLIQLLTEVLSRLGCSINLSLTSKREPFTQHLWMFNVNNISVYKYNYIGHNKLWHLATNLTTKDLSFAETLHNTEFSCKCCAFCNKTEISYYSAN
jgi:hypothetical protein